LPQLPVGAPIGDKNAAKIRLFDDAFRRALKQRDLNHEDGATLRKIADKIIDLALAGDVSAFREARDTVDGKPAQAITGADGGPLQVEQIQRVIVDEKT
jgi:hypothetical protein